MYSQFYTSIQIHIFYFNLLKRHREIDTISSSNKFNHTGCISLKILDDSNFIAKPELEFLKWLAIFEGNFSNIQTALVDTSQQVLSKGHWIGSKKTSASSKLDN